MACATSDDELTPTRKIILKAIKDTPLKINEIAEKTALPLFKVRSNLRYMTEIDFVTLEDNHYTITSKAIKVL